MPGAAASRETARRVGRRRARLRDDVNGPRRKQPSVEPRGGESVLRVQRANRTGTTRGLGRGVWVEGSRDRRSRVEGRGSRVEGRGSRVEGWGTRAEGTVPVAERTKERVRWCSALVRSEGLNVDCRLQTMAAGLPRADEGKLAGRARPSWGVWVRKWVWRAADGSGWAVDGCVGGKCRGSRELPVATIPCRDNSSPRKTCRNPTRLITFPQFQPPPALQPPLSTACLALSLWLASPTRTRSGRAQRARCATRS